jgi:hypothetical protein
MIPAYWRHLDNPRGMLRVVRERVAGRPEFARLLRLFGCAAARVVWLYVPDGACRRAVEVAERFADGEATADELAEARRAAERQAVLAARGRRSAAWAGAATTDPDESNAARRAVEEVTELFADNAFETDRNARALGHLLTDLFDPYVPDGRFTPTNPPDAVLDLWRFATDRRVRDAADEIYRENDFREFALLGDVLRTAGCSDPKVLDHCRSGRHARGSWVIDALSGRGCPAAVAGG